VEELRGRGGGRRRRRRRRRPCDCSSMHSIARTGSGGFYAFDSPCDIPSLMQLMGCNVIGGAVSGFPEGRGSSFSQRCHTLPPSPALPHAPNAADRRYHGLKCALFSTDALIMRLNLQDITRTYQRKLSALGMRRKWRRRQQQQPTRTWSSFT